jgi:hypothetical protein
VMVRLDTGSVALGMFAVFNDQAAVWENVVTVINATNARTEERIVL